MKISVHVLDMPFKCLGIECFLCWNAKQVHINATSKEEIHSHEREKLRRCARNMRLAEFAGEKNCC